MVNNQPSEYSIQELAHKAGVSVRTIRFYIDEGLLPAAPVKGRYAAYDEEYVDRLELIRRLKDAFLPLKEIRERVVSLSWNEVKQALSRPEPSRRIGEPGEQALSYISRILHEAPPRPRPPARLTHADEALASPSASPPTLAPTLAPASAPASAPAAAPASAPAPADIAEPAAPATAAPASAALASAALATAATEAWERLTLAPGVELHIRSGINPGDRRLAQQLKDYAQKLFDRSPKGGR